MSPERNVAHLKLIRLNNNNNNNISQVKKAYIFNEALLKGTFTARSCLLPLSNPSTCSICKAKLYIPRLFVQIRLFLLHCCLFISLLVFGFNLI